MSTRVRTFLLALASLHIVSNLSSQAADHERASSLKARINEFLNNYYALSNDNRVSALLRAQLTLAQEVYSNELACNQDVQTLQSPEELQSAIAIFSTEEVGDTKSDEERHFWYNKCLEEQQLELNNLWTALTFFNTHGYKTSMNPVRKAIYKECPSLDIHNEPLAPLYNKIMEKAVTCANTMRIYTMRPSFVEHMLPLSPSNPVLGALCLIATKSYERVHNKYVPLLTWVKAAACGQMILGAYKNTMAYRQKMQTYLQMKHQWEQNRLR